MKKIMLLGGFFILMSAASLIPGCSSEDSPTEPSPPVPVNLPDVPVPGSTVELLPAVSDDYTVGLSDEIEDFTPVVSEIRMMLDDGSTPWIVENRRLILACPDVLPENTGDPDITDRTYITARPRLNHQRYWRKIKQVTLDPGTSTYEYEESITSGTSTSHEESREFSQTMGIEVSVSAGWGPFSASVTASFEQTETVGEVNCVTFNEETSVTQTFSVQSDPDHTTVYAIWQLVDKFTLVDADTVRIHESESLAHAVIPEVASIVFPNRDVIYQSITYFD